MAYLNEASQSDRRTVTNAIGNLNHIISRLEGMQEYTTNLANRIAGPVPTPAKEQGGKYPERIHQSMIDLVDDKRDNMNRLLDQIEENFRRLDNNL